MTSQFSFLLERESERLGKALAKLHSSAVYVLYMSVTYLKLNGILYVPLE